MEEFFQLATERAASHGTHFERIWQLAGQSASGGKLVRPILLIRTYEALTSEGSRITPRVEREVVESLAVAVELLHYSFLLHDDVIDRDVQRRGRPNLIGAMLGDSDLAHNEKSRSLHWAQSCGILMGDLLLSSAHQIFARAAVPDALRNALLDLLDETIMDSVAGEQIDVGLSDAIISPELSTILDMTVRKTATYTFELPMRMAAVLAGSSPVVRNRLGEIGRHLGLGFQLHDDLLSAFGDPKAHGKDPYSDLREGKQTAIIAAARTTPAWPRLEALLGKAIFSGAEAARASDLLVECGAQGQVVALVDRELCSAATLIDAPGSELPDAVRRVLHELIDRLRGRQS